MKITCWGSRGSLPVSGSEYFKYGGDTACLDIRTGSGDIIIIDAGTGVRRLGNKLLEEGIDSAHFIFTHAHWDHLMGFPFFKPIYIPGTRLFMHRCPFHKTFVEKTLNRIMSQPYFPVRYKDIQADISYEDACPTPFEIGSVKIMPISISHPNGGSGYKFIEDDRSFVFLTDNELGFAHPGDHSVEAYIDFCGGTDLLIHDAEYTPEEYLTTRGWGHSVFTDTIDLAMAAGVNNLGLYHLNQERTDTQMDQIVLACQDRIKEKGIEMRCKAVRSDALYNLE